MGKYNKIYVLAPFGAATGGIELAHQLVDYLRNKKQECFIVYIDKTFEISKDQTLTAQYRNYNVQSSNIIEDKNHNMLVLPEIYFDFIYKYTNINIACWWMSVDNHYSNACFRDIFGFQSSLIKKLRIIKHLLKGDLRKSRNSIKDLKANSHRIIHFYQSHYAQYHLYSLGFNNVLPLSDFINTEFEINCNTPKEDIILYNPSKGYKFTKKIIKKMPHRQFVPLKGLSRTQLKELMTKAKLYIDFGHFPGKDRLPRETAMSGCCIITGKLGASFYYEDLPINETYKFETKKSNIGRICDRIDYVLDHYDSCIKDFEYYKKRIIKEKGMFYDEIDDFFINI